MGPINVYKNNTPEAYKEFEWHEKDTYKKPEE